MIDFRDCDCGGRPRMIRLGYPGSDRFYFCRLCGVIRWERSLFDTPGSWGDTLFLQHDDARLPAIVQQGARVVLAMVEPEQGRLF